MTDRKTHADFDAAAEEHRYAGKLAELRKVLRDRAYQLRGEWAWVVLPNGALVAMRVRAEDFRKELRIARRGTPKSDEGWGRWHQEREVFKKHLGIEDWNGEYTVGKCEAVYLEPTPMSDARRQEVPCSECGQPTANDPLYKKPVCNSCAMKLGKRDAEQLNLDHQQKAQHGG